MSGGAPAIDASLRGAPVMDRSGYPYLIHPLTDGVPRCSPELLREWARWAAEQPECQAASVIVAPEAMALPLAAALSLHTGMPYLAARKRSYGLPGEVAAPARTGYGSATLHVNGLGPGDRALVVDDILSTGGTLDALLAAIRSTGATAAGALAFVDKGTAREALAQRHGVQVKAMRTVRVEGGRVQVSP